MSNSFYVVGVTFPRENNSASKVYYYKCPKCIHVAIGGTVYVNSPIKGETPAMVTEIWFYSEMTPSKSIIGVLINGIPKRLEEYSKEERLEELLIQATSLKQEIQSDKEAELKKAGLKKRKHYEGKMYAGLEMLKQANLAKEDFLVVKRMIIDMEERANG